MIGSNAISRVSSSRPGFNQQVCQMYFWYDCSMPLSCRVRMCRKSHRGLRSSSGKTSESSLTALDSDLSGQKRSMLRVDRSMSRCLQRFGRKFMIGLDGPPISVWILVNVSSESLASSRFNLCALEKRRLCCGVPSISSWRKRGGVPLVKSISRLPAMAAASVFPSAVGFLGFKWGDESASLPRTDLVLSREGLGSISSSSGMLTWRRVEPCEGQRWESMRLTSDGSGLSRIATYCGREVAHIFLSLIFKDHWLYCLSWVKRREAGHVRIL